MIKNAPAILAAFSMYAASPNDASAQSSGIHQWSDPSKAEFVVENVKTKFLFPSLHYGNQDVHVDCDLMVIETNPDGSVKPIVPIGFIGQFNAETNATWNALTPQARQALENWKGSLDWRKSSQTGVLAHMQGQHEISMSQVGAAGQRCWDYFRDHAVRKEDVPTVHGSHHNDYD